MVVLLHQDDIFEEVKDGIDLIERLRLVIETSGFHYLLDDQSWCCFHEAVLCLKGDLLFSEFGKEFMEILNRELWPD